MAHGEDRVDRRAEQATGMLRGAGPMRRRRRAAFMPTGRSGSARPADLAADPEAQFGNLVDFIRRYDHHELVPVLLCLLADGQPVLLGRIAATLDRTVAAVAEMLRGLPNPECDEQGRLVGLGLTLRPTPHRYATASRTLYTWCASDALMFPAVLGQPALVTSTCPATGRPIRIEADPDGLRSVDPAETVVSRLVPAGRPIDIRASLCDHGRFFASAEAARGWLARHPDGQLVGVGEHVRMDQAALRRVGWAAAPTTAALEG